MPFGGNCPYCIRDGKRGQYKKRYKSLLHLQKHCVWNHSREDYRPILEKFALDLLGGIRVV